MSHKFIDNRPVWDIPGAVPLSTGPVRTPAARPSPLPTLSEDGAVYEFLVPSPMHILDAQDWPSIQCQVMDRDLRINKPRPGTALWSLPDRLGNEPQEAFGCILTAFCPRQHDGLYPLPAAVWDRLEVLLRWIRVKARHFWLPEGTLGFSAACRGSALKQEDENLDYKNFARYAPTVVIRPLSREIWVSLAEDLASGYEPPVSESIFCDGLQSIAAQDQRKAALELGVACEVEITDLLVSVAKKPPLSSEKEQFLELREKGHDRFKDKLRKWPRKMGIKDPREFKLPKLPEKWVDEAIELYGLRNSIAHSGALDVSEDQLNRYVFSASALFAYCRSIRLIEGAETYNFPTGLDPRDQLFAIRGGWMDATT